MLVVFKRFVDKVEVYKGTGLFSLKRGPSFSCPSVVTNGKSQLKPYTAETLFYYFCSLNVQYKM